MGWMWRQRWLGEIFWFLVCGFGVREFQKKVGLWVEDRRGVWIFRWGVSQMLDVGDLEEFFVLFGMFYLIICNEKLYF